LKGISIIHKILLVLTILAAVFCGWMAVEYFRIPIDEYENTAAQLTADAESLRMRKTEREDALAQEYAQDQETLAQEQQRRDELSAQLAEVQLLHEQKQQKLAETDELVSSLDNIQDVIVNLRVEYGDTVRQLEEKIVAGESDVKICYLTFDDGPTNITDQFIAKLEELDVYATFFTIGANSSTNQTENLRAEMMGGHTIANHSFNHAYDTGLYANLDVFTKQVELQDQKVFEATGFHTDIFRFPSGSYYCYFRDQATSWLNENGYQWIDWSGNCYDSGANGAVRGAAAISWAMVEQCKTMDICVMLAHDWNYGTLGALDTAIPELKELGYVFLPMFPQSLTMGEATRSNYG